MRRFDVVATTKARNTFIGNGVTTTFVLDFVFFEDTSLAVTLVVDATGAETVKTLTTDYTVSGGNGAAGTVTATSFVPAVGETLVIERVEPPTQDTDYTSYDTFNAETTENRLDRIIMAVQRVLDLTLRSVKLPITDDPSSPANLTLPAPEAGKFVVGKDASSWENKDAAALGAVSIPVPITDGGTGAITAAAARTNLGAATNPVPLEQLATATQGDILYYGVAGAPAVLGAGSAGQFLKTQGAGANPVWASPPAPTIKVFTASGTYMKPAGLVAAHVRLVGGGGSGGAIVTSATPSPGGGGGGYAEELLAAASIGATETVTIGAGGAAVTTTAGNAGGTTSFGTLLSATGGGGGGSGNVASGAGGAGAGGDVNLVGQDGGLIGGGLDGGGGGSSHLGGGGRGGLSNAAGAAGGNYGGGGGGSGGNSASSGAGAGGIVVVLEYY